MGLDKVNENKRDSFGPIGERRKRKKKALAHLYITKKFGGFLVPCPGHEHSNASKWREAVSVPSDAKRKKCRHCLGVSLEESCTQFEGIDGVL